jgi:hypothetical protein
MNEQQAADHQPFPDGIVRLPLWKSALDDLVREGVYYGQTIKAEWFEDRLRTKREAMQFGIAISEIRRELEVSGYYLSGRGQKGNQFVILPPSSNADVMEHYSRAAADALKRGVILGTGTRLDTLSEDERRRHEGILERMALKAVLLQRSARIKKLVEQHQPTILHQNPEPEPTA